MTEGYLRDPDKSGDYVEGYWSLASNRIVLANADTLNGSTVRHEMLHALLRVAGHPRSAFLQNCGGVVACSQECVQDAGPGVTPDPATPTVPPSELEVTTAVSPANPSPSIDGGVLTFTITVRNPYSHPVIALLPQRSGGGPPHSFLYEFRRTDGGGVNSADWAFDPGVTYFSAEETKRDLIDLVIVTGGSGRHPSATQGTEGWPFAPGTYVFRGGYRDYWARELTVVLNP